MNTTNCTAREIAALSAALDPDGQVYPWRDLYPLAGSTVATLDGQLWHVLGKDRNTVTLVHAEHDLGTIVSRDELRPVTWTAADEAAHLARN